MPFELSRGTSNILNISAIFIQSYATIESQAFVKQMVIFNRQQTSHRPLNESQNRFRKARIESHRFDLDQNHGRQKASREVRY